MSLLVLIEEFSDLAQIDALVRIAQSAAAHMEVTFRVVFAEFLDVDFVVFENILENG
jgi:hypothetical protein